MTTSIFFFAWNAIAIAFFMFALIGLTRQYVVTKYEAAQKVRAEINHNARIKRH